MVDVALYLFLSLPQDQALFVYEVGLISHMNNRYRNKFKHLTHIIRDTIRKLQLRYNLTEILSGIFFG